MPCYLCAYQLDAEPEALDELPDAEPEALDELPDDDPEALEEPSASWAWWALGTCSICSVWACALHGTRYGQFECAMCTPAVATQHALSPTAPSTDLGAGAVAAAVAYEVGVHASDEVKAGVEAAVGRIAQHQRLVSPLEALSLARPQWGEPDLLLNFAEVIREQAGGQARVDFLPGVRREAQRESTAPEAPQGPGPWVSIDAVGAAVRAAFAGRVIDVTQEGIDIVTGALLLSMAVANRPQRRRHGPEMVNAALEAEVARPWQVTHPVLLDPVMWMVATAYEDER